MRKNFLGCRSAGAHPHISLNETVDLAGKSLGGRQFAGHDLACDGLR
jgi:hypothetical protein